MNANASQLDEDQVTRVLKREYWCFISYRHANNKEPGRQWATWLHQALETYEVPADLVGTRNDRGDIIPERIFPVFRDEEELPADSELSRLIESALQRSRFLVAICSPQSVKSRWVAEEILRFKQLGKEKYLLAAIVEGNPNVSDDPERPGSHSECFPLPIRYHLGGDGQLSSERAEPTAADFRLPDGNQGWTSPTAYREVLENSGLSRSKISVVVSQFAANQNLMLLKIIAGVLGVPLGYLTERDKAYKLEIVKARALALRRWVVALSVLAFAAVASGTYALINQREAENQRARAEKQTSLAIQAAQQETEQRKLAEAQKSQAEKQTIIANDQREIAVHEEGIARNARREAEDLAVYMQTMLENELAKVNDLSLKKKIQEKVLEYQRNNPAKDSEQDKILREVDLLFGRAVVAQDQGDDQLATKLYGSITTRLQDGAWNDKDLSYKANFRSVRAALGALQSISAVLTSDEQIKTIMIPLAEKLSSDSEKILSQWPADPDIIYHSSMIFVLFSKLNYEVGYFDKSNQLMTKAIYLLDKSVTNGNANRSVFMALINCGVIVGDRAFRDNRLDVAIQQYKSSRDRAKSLSEDQPDNEDYKRNLALSIERIGEVAVKRKNYVESSKLFREVVDLQRQRVLMDTSNVTWLFDYVYALYNCSKSMQQSNVADQALAFHYLENAETALSDLRRLQRGLDDKQQWIEPAMKDLRAALLNSGKK
ncbi:MAG: TIR domain-containing protein [Luteolibacter sp.]|uniref:TIR domain-containing protein n=1 Tax=Luteolibacter sp. TaxID=1962973 RepID=UPI003265192E